MEENRKLRVAALISGGGTNLQAIIDRCEDGSLPAEVVVVGSDNPEAKGLNRATKHGIKNFNVAPKESRPDIAKKFIKTANINMYSILKKMGYSSDILLAETLRKIYQKVHHEARILTILKESDPDLLVLAGYMRLLTPYLIDEFNQGADKIMNIHPAILPAFPGTDGYGDTYRYGSRVGGCTIHFVDYGEDTGPIIGQRTFRIISSDTLDDIKRKGLELEWKLYPECIKLFAEDRLEVIKRDNRKIVLIKENQKKCVFSKCG